MPALLVLLLALAAPPTPHPAPVGSPPAAVASHDLAGDLLRAVEAGDTPQVVAQLARGADPNQMSKFRIGVLARACERGDLATARVLLGAGASVAATTSWGETPLFGAVRSGRIEVVDALLGAGADPNARAKHGLRPLLLAAGEGNLAIVDRLLAAGAATDVANAEGWTPLHLAAWAGSLPLVERFLERGVAPDARNQFGQDARLVALVGAHPEVAARLEATLRQRGLPVLEPPPTPTEWDHAGDLRWEERDYPLDGCVVRLRGGRSESRTGPCAVEAIDVLLGDLTGDGEAEATVALHLRPAADRSAVVVLIYRLVDRRPALLARLPAAGESASELRELRLDGGSLLVELVGDGMSGLQRSRYSGGVLAFEKVPEAGRR